MQDETRALDMTQEVVPETRTVRRALDESRDVRHDEILLVVRLHDAEHGHERREMVSGNLRTRRRNRRDEARFADARIADESDIGEQLELQQKLLALSRFAKLRKRRRTVRRIGEACVAAPAAPRLRDDGLLPNLREIGEHRARRRILDERSRRHLDDARFGVRARHILDVPVAAILALELPMIAEIEQGVHIAVDDEDDVRTAAAVTARRPALGDELLAAERRLSLAAIPRFHADLRTIDKLHRCLLSRTPSASSLRP